MVVYKKVKKLKTSKKSLLLRPLYLIFTFVLLGLIFIYLSKAATPSFYLRINGDVASDDKTSYTRDVVVGSPVVYSWDFSNIVTGVSSPRCHIFYTSDIRNHTQLYQATTYSTYVSPVGSLDLSGQLLATNPSYSNVQMYCVDGSNQKLTLSGGVSTLNFIINVYKPGSPLVNKLQVNGKTGTVYVLKKQKLTLSWDVLNARQCHEYHNGVQQGSYVLPYSFITKDVSSISSSIQTVKLSMDCQQIPTLGSSYVASAVTVKVVSTLPSGVKASTSTSKVSSGGSVSHTSSSQTSPKTSKHASKTPSSSTDASPSSNLTTSSVSASTQKRWTITDLMVVIGALALGVSAITFFVVRRLA